MALNLHFFASYNILCPFLHFWFSIWSKQHLIYIMSSSLQWSCSLCSVSSWVHSFAELKAACGRCRHGCIFGNTFMFISTLNAYLHSEQPFYLFESQSIWLFSLCLPHCSLVALSFSVFPWSLFLYFSLSWRFTTMYYWQILPQQPLPFIRLSKKLFTFSSVASFVLKCKHFADLIKKYYNCFCWWTQGSTAIFSSYTNISIWIFVNIIYFSETLSYIWCCHMKVSKKHSLQMCIYRLLAKMTNNRVYYKGFWLISCQNTWFSPSFRLWLSDYRSFFGGWRVECSHM